MPIKSNRYYNDPAIGAAFENLAAAFAPPSGADAAGWARANAEREAASRLTWLFNNPNDPTSSNRSALIGVQDYSQTPGGFAATDATNRRGQDVTAQTALAANAATNAATRYGYDLNAQTSRANNDADNARAVEQTRITSLGGLFGPVAEGAVRPEIPGNIASQFGVEGPIAPAEGRQKPMSSDEVIGMALQAMPPEQVNQFVTDKFAPSETQVQGQERRALVANGDLTTQDLVNDVLSAMPVENVVGPDGQPVVVARADAIGQRPFIDRGSDPAPKVENWIGPDGTGGIAVFDRETNQYVDTASKQPLPAGSRTYTGQLTGGTEATGFGKTTEAQDRNAYAATMAEAPTNRLLKAFDTGQLPSTTDYVLFNAMAKLPTAAAPALVSQMSESGQLFYQDLRTTLPFQLMTQSGAAVTEQEYDRKLLELIPVPGESSGVTAAKRQQFETYVKAVRGVAGAAYDKIHATGQIEKPALPGAAASSASTPAAPPAPANGPVRVSSPEEAMKLPSGTVIILPDGSEGRVP